MQRLCCSLYQNILKPGKLEAKADLYLFIEGVKPDWDEQETMAGGLWTAAIPKTAPNGKQLLDEWWLDSVRNYLTPCAGSVPRTRMFSSSPVRVCRLCSACLAKQPCLVVLWAFMPVTQQQVMDSCMTARLCIMLAGHPHYQLHCGTDRERDLHNTIGYSALDANTALSIACFPVCRKWIELAVPLNQQWEHHHNWARSVHAAHPRTDKGMACAGAAPDWGAV